MRRLFTWTGWTKDDWIVQAKGGVALFVITGMILLAHALPVWLFS